MENVKLISKYFNVHTEKVRYKFLRLLAEFKKLLFKWYFGIIGVKLLSNHNCLKNNQTN